MLSMLLYLLLYLLSVPVITMITQLYYHDTVALDIIGVLGPEACFTLQPKTMFEHFDFLTSFLLVNNNSD